MISDQEILNIVRAELKESIGYSGESSALHENRAFLMDSYNCEPYGDEVEGRSKVISADVFEVIEGQLPTLVDMFTQGKTARFKETRPEYKQEAQEKEYLANYVFSELHNPVSIILSQLKDGMLQYTGVHETYWDDSEQIEKNLTFESQTEQDLIDLQVRDDIEIIDVEETEDGYTVQAKQSDKSGKVRIESVPPNEFVISKRARCFDTSPLIGKITPKTRSELISMGFDKKQVMNLGRGEGITDSVQAARYRDLGGKIEYNPSEDRSKDVISLAKLFVRMDADEDGTEELWLIYYAHCDQDEILKKEKVDSHNFSVYNPIPMPGRAIGTCDAAQVADYQYWKSTLIRHLNDNIYATNYSRIGANDLVNLDDLLTPRHGGIVRVKGSNPIQQAIQPFTIPNQVNEIIAAIELADRMIERRTGVTRYNQGLDAEDLTSTVGGFKGISRLSHKRMRLKAQIYADYALKKIFEDIIKLYSMHSKDVKIPVGDGVLELKPMAWKDKTSCTIRVGTNAIDEQNHISNLSYLLEQQKLEREMGSPLVDNKKIYNTYKEIISAIEAGDVSEYYNDPEVPQQLLIAEIEKLTRENMALQQQVQNPLAEAESIKQQATTQREIAKIQTKAQFDMLKAQQEQMQHDDRIALDMAKIMSDIKQKEAETGRDIPEEEIIYYYDQTTGGLRRGF